MKESEPYTHNTLILFTRFPSPGKVKSRLIPSLGAKRSASLQRQMTEYVFSILGRFCLAQHTSFLIFFDGGSPEAMSDWLGKDFHYLRQPAGTLGVRLFHGFKRARLGGARNIVAVGSDCPFISEELLLQAFNDLEENDIVLGPATDGGYYLIGLRKMPTSLFKNIDWGSERVFHQTLMKAGSEGLSCSVLRALPDIDRPEDLSLLGEIFDITDFLPGPDVSP